MSWTLKMVVARVKSLVDANTVNSFVTPEFVYPLVNQVYEDCNNQLVSTQSSWDLSIVEVPGIVAGTPNLLDAQSGTGPLVTLTDQPVRIDWKPAGTPAEQYQYVTNYEVLPDVNPQQGIGGWEWRSEVIWLTPSSFDVDLRIRGEFGPAPLSQDDDVLTSHPRIGLPVSYGVAALIGEIRGNPSWAQQYGQKAVEALDEILADLTRSTQAQTRRVGRMPRNGRYNRDWVAWNQ